MDKKHLEDIIKPSTMQKFNEINEIYKQIDPLYQITNSSKISEMMEKNARISLASNIGEIARKVFQQSSLDFTSFENQSTIAMAADLGFQNTITTQDTLLEMKKGMSAYNNIMSVREKMIQSMGGTNVYDDIMGSVNLARKSMEPFRESFNAARIAFEANEPFKIAKELQSQVAFANSLLSGYTGIFKQFESLRNLDSFRSISRLNNSQFEEVLSTNLTQEEITNFSSKPISEIDSDLSDGIKSGKNFSSYSEKDKKYLSYIFHTYLLPVVFIIFGILLAPHIEQAQEEAKILTTQQKVRAFTRSAPITFDRNALKGHRFTMINNLNFRDQPSMNSNVIDSLPIGTTVRVINKSYRSWLLIEVEINGELEQGWVLRRYTTYFK